MNKRYTEKTAAAVCNKLLKRCQKDSAKKEAFHKAWIDAAGRQCVCDGYRAYRIRAALDTVPTNHEAIPMDLDKIFKPLDAGDVVEIPAPDPEAVRLAITDGKNHDRAGLYDFGPGKPAFNAEYLLDVLRLFPCGRWYVEASESRRTCAPAFIVDDAGSACICPVRKRPEAAAEPAPEEQRPAPKTAPEQPAEKAAEPVPSPVSTKYAFFVYAKHPGDRNFSLADPARGTNKLQVFYTPRFTEQSFPKLKTFLEFLAAVNPGTVYQIRTIEKKKTVYTTDPETAVFEPSDFAELFAA